MVFEGESAAIKSMQRHRTVGTKVRQNIFASQQKIVTTGVMFRTFNILISSLKSAL